MAVELAPPLSHNIKTLEGNSGHLTPENVSSNALLHELQLGEQLNESVSQTRRADFTLMLAMLAEDVREQSQFLLPQAEKSEPVDMSNTGMRQQFNLPRQAPMALKTLDDIKQFNQAQNIVDNDLANIHLANAMTPKPLAFRNDKKHIESQILQNTSLFTQLKYQQAQVVSHDTKKTLSQPMKFNANAWLDNVQESLVKAPLLN